MEFLFKLRAKSRLISQKISITYVWKSSKYTSAVVSISCTVIKKHVKIKHTSINLFKDFLGNTLPWSISLIFIPYDSHKKKINFKRHSLTKHLFRLNIFAIYLPLKLILFIVHIFSIRAFFIKQKLFLLSWKELTLTISIINAPLDIDWLTSFSSYKLLIGLFEFSRKAVETACY